MNRHLGFVRALMASAAIAAAVALTGCQTDEIAHSGRAMQPMSGETRSLIASKNMAIESPILVRIFKEESELEIWKKDHSGRFALLKTYPICRWSGDLGPKVKQGDRQAPEGFYTVTPGQMNPNSSYYLSFNLGFPNAFDRAHGRSGAFLMVHGDCSSAGCYSMSDAQMAEIYALGREAFLGGQRAFQVQAYPFRMTPLNLAKHRNNPHFAFWRMLKEGNDHFEVTRQEPKIDVCDRRYVFNATPGSGPFNSTGSCPRIQVSEQIAAAVEEKRDQDEQEFAALVRQGTHTVAVDTGSDGGMHPSFVAKLQPQMIVDTTGRPAAYTKPGSGLPTLVRLPRALENSVFGRPALTQVASADSSQPIVATQSAPEESNSGNFFTRLLSGNQASAAASQEAPRKEGSSSAGAAKTRAAASAAKPKSETKTAAKTTPDAARSTRSASAAKPESSSAAKAESVKDKPKRKEASASSKSKAGEPTSTASASAGGASQPAVPSTNFDSRFGGWR